MVTIKPPRVTPPKAQIVNANLKSGARDTTNTEYFEKLQRERAQAELKQRLIESQRQRAEQRAAGQERSNFSKYAEDERKLREYIETQTAQLKKTTESESSAIEAQNRDLRKQLSELQQGQARIETREERIETRERETESDLRSFTKKAGSAAWGATSATAGAAAGMAGLAVRGVGSAGSAAIRNSSTGTFWVVMFFILSMLDIWGNLIFPGIKSPYAGFFFPFEQMRWQFFFGIITSMFFLGILLSKFIFDLMGKKLSALPYVGYFVIYYFMKNSGFGQIAENIMWIATVVGAFILLYILFGRDQQSHLFSVSDIPFFLYALTITVILNNCLSLAAAGDFLPLLHLIFIMLFCYLFIKPVEGEDSSFYLWSFIFLFADFFGTGTFTGILLTQNIPFGFALVTYYVASKTQKIFPVIIVVIFLIFTIGLNWNEQNKGAIGDQISLNKNTAVKSASERLDSISRIFSNFFKTRYEMATQFGGTVEQNQYESLGVYFSDLKAAQPRFYTDEPIIIWGGIRSKTYQDAVVVTTSCYKKKDEKTRESGTIKPSKPFLVYQLDETDVECQFKPNQFPAGTHSITMAADYNFITNANQKVYFIGKERYRNYIREGLDPLTEFGIKDKNPVTTFTNGPVEVGMKIDPLIAIDSFDEYPVLPAIYITLTNRKEITDKDKKIVSRWEGKIKDINELVILTPPGVTIPKPEECQPLSFTELNEDTCKKSCTEGITSVKENCARACDSSPSTKESCIVRQCTEIVQKCSDDCYYLFRGDGQDSSLKYKAYALDLTKIPQTYMTYARDIDKFKTFSCRIQPSKEALSASAPLTTSYFRIRARYNYQLENTVPIVIEQSPYQVTTTQTIPSLLRQTALNGAYDSAMDAKQDTMLNDAASIAGQNERLYSGTAFAIAKELNVDYFLVKAIIQAESSWSPTAERYEGRIDDYSVGLMQVLTSTAKQIGCIDTSLSLADARASLQTPETNIRCGVKYLRTLIDAQASNGLKVGISNVMGGYNGGVGAMAYSKDAGKTHLTVWENEANTGYAITRAYVKKVTENYNTLIQKAGLQQQGQAGTTILQLKAAINGNQASLSWSPSKETETSRFIYSYYVNRVEGGNPTYVSTCMNVASGAASYSCTDPTAMTAGSTVTYKLNAVDSDGNILLSEEKSLTASQSTAQSSSQSSIQPQETAGISSMQIA